MDTADSIGVYGEAKAEYTRQLCSFLVPALEGYFLDLLNDVKTNEKDTKRILWVFQDQLKQFPDWNVDKVQRETEKIQTATRCDYLEEILTAVFIAHTKVLSAIRLTSKQKKLQITIPKIDHFLHRTMSECARLLWSNAYLFSESGPAVERQKNLRQVEQLLHEGVLQSIRGMLPVKSILKEYLTDDGEEPTVNESTAEQAPEENIPPVIHEEEQEKKEEEQSEEAENEKPVEPVIEKPVEPVIEKPMETILEKPKEPVDISGSEPPTPIPPPAPPSTPTIIVDTEPPTVGFTHMDTVFDSENPNKNTIQISNQIDNNDDEQQEVTYIEYDDSMPGENLDDFEELEKNEESLAVGEDEFETL